MRTEKEILMELNKNEITPPSAEKVIILAWVLENHSE
jgi:hypothetical protein